MLLPLFFLFFHALSAQTFTEAPQSPLFAGALYSTITFGDVDGDNDQDVVISGFADMIGASTKLYLNDGTGNFTEVEGTPFTAITRGAIAMADIDGDDDLDLLLTGEKGPQNRIAVMYTNDGSGTFTEVANTPFEGVYFSSVAFADVDGDDDQDVFITGTRIPFKGIMSKLYTNDGAGNFTEAMGTPFDAVRRGATAFADMDGDNDLDLLITGEDESFAEITKLYSNDGLGNFTEVAGTPFIGVNWGDLQVADVDGDNDLDVLITGINADGEGLIARLYTNEGQNNFTEVPNTPFDPVQFCAHAFADVDNDNDQDVIITGRRTTGLPNISKLYINDGTGAFSELANTPFEGISSGTLAFADVDNDDDQDVLIAGNNSLGDLVTKLYINEGVNSTSAAPPNSLALDLSLFPNPTPANTLNISFASEKAGPIRIEVHGVSGQLLSRQQAFAVIGQQTLSMDISYLAAGSYLLRVDDGQRKGLAQFVVE